MNLPAQRGARPVALAGHPLLRALARATALGTIAQQQSVLLASRLPDIIDPAEHAHVAVEGAFMRLFEGAMASGAELCWTALRTPDRPRVVAAPFDPDEANTMLVVIWAAGLGDRLERYRLVLSSDLPAVTDRDAQRRVVALAARAETLLAKTRKLEQELLAAAGITAVEDGQ